MNSRTGALRTAVQMLIGLAAWASTVDALSAEMPKDLKGFWILDAKATAAYMQTSPKWKAEDAKYLPRIIQRMSQATYLFEDGKITVSTRGRQQPLDVVLKTSEKPRYVFEGNVGDQALTLPVSITEAGNLNIRSSATDDMDYYLWKRGKLAAGGGEKKP